MIDRASDALGVQRLLVGRRASVIIQIATALGYMAAYLGLREASNDQWYLPAGLRFAALLVAPYRLWPALFVGDVAALAIFRGAMVPEYGLAYYAFSSIAAWPVVALIVRQVRRADDLLSVKKPTDAIALVVASLIAAELVSITNKAMVAWLKIGGATMVYSDLLVYSLGHVQGILLAVFAVTLISNWRERRQAGEWFGLDSVLAVALCLGLVEMMQLTGPHDAAALMAVRLCLLIPAVALTLRNAWRGAAVGTIIANVALFFTIPHQDAGQVDGAALLMQEAFTFVSATLFVLGARTPTKSCAPAARQDFDRDDDAREQFEAHERRQRDTALRAEAMQRDSRDRLSPFLTLLRKSGQAEAAMNLVGMAHTQASQFGRSVIDSIYPLTLERLGLFASFESEAFAGHFGSIPYTFDLTGSSYRMSLETKLTAYRVLGEAIEQLVLTAPERLIVRVRCSNKADGRGMISMVVRAIGATNTVRSMAQTAQRAQLRTRVKAYGGSLHNRAGCIRMIVLDESVQAATTNRMAEAGPVVKRTLQAAECSD